MSRRRANRWLRRSERPSQGAQGVAAVVNVPGSSIITPSTVTVSGWISSGGRWYYTLTHSKKRRGLIGLTLVDLHTGGYFWPDEVISSDIDTVVIWLTMDPGANRVAIFYL